MEDLEEPHGGFWTPRVSTAPSSTPTSSVPRDSLSSAQPTSPPQTPVWTTEPPSIHEPLLLLDEEQERAAALERQMQLMATIDQLRAELAEVRAARKERDAALEALTTSFEALESTCVGLRAEQTRLEQENGVLRLQLQDHHGIMANDWAQTLQFQERLRHEEAARAQLADEVAELREGLATRTEEAAQFRQDAALWRILCTDSDGLAEVNSDELDGVLEVTSAALARLQAEASSRWRAAKQQLHNELEQQLCVVCRDEKKAVLFVPCLHVCVCEGCRGRLRPYRCPMCQVPVQGAVARVHF